SRVRGPRDGRRRAAGRGRDPAIGLLPGRRAYQSPSISRVCGERCEELSRVARSADDAQAAGRGHPQISHTAGTATLAELPRVNVPRHAGLGAYDLEPAEA